MLRTRWKNSTNIEMKEQKWWNPGSWLEWPARHKIHTFQTNSQNGMLASIPVCFLKIQSNEWETWNTHITSAQWNLATVTIAPIPLSPPW